MFVNVQLELKQHFFYNWDPFKGEPPLKGMELKEKESQKSKVCARNIRFMRVVLSVREIQLGKNLLWLDGGESRLLAAIYAR